MSNNFGLGMAGTNGRSGEAKVRGAIDTSSLSDEEVAAKNLAAEKHAAAMQQAAVAAEKRMATKRESVIAVIGDNWSNRSKRMAQAKQLVSAGVFDETCSAMEWLMTNH